MHKTSILDTKTYPEPDKTADDLWFDYRVGTQYGSLWERAEESIALTMEKAINSPLPKHDDVRGALQAIRAGESLRPRIDDFNVTAKFKRDELGQGAQENYWRTQGAFLSGNKQRDKAYKRMLANLAKARRILSKSVAA